MELTLKRSSNKIAIFDGKKEVTSFDTDSVDYVLTWLKFNLTNYKVEIK